MKNRDIIKKSIEDNIVDSQIIINNMKAKAAQTESSDRRSFSGRSYAKKAALLCTCLALAIVFVSSPAIFFNKGNGTVATKETSKQDDNNTCEISSFSFISETAMQSESNDVQSRNGQGTESVSEIIKEPLNNEDRLFFASFTQKVEVMRKIMSGLLSSDTDAEAESFAPVTEPGFSDLSDISDFLNNLLTPAVAQQYYYDAALSENCIFKEINGILYQRVGCPQIPYIEFFTETAYYAEGGSEQMLKINCLVQIEGQQYYYCFYFIKSNEIWLFDYSKEDNRT